MEVNNAAINNAGGLKTNRLRLSAEEKDIMTSNKGLELEITIDLSFVKAIDA